MTKIVVLGAGIGGVPLGFELKDMLGKSAEITVVSQTDYFQLVPSNPWVAVKWRKPTDVKVSLPEVFKRRKIGFTSVGAKRVKPNENSLSSMTGRPCPTTIWSSRRGRTSPLTRLRGLVPRPTPSPSAMSSMRASRERNGRSSARIPDRW